MSYGYNLASDKYQLAADLETRASVLDADADRVSTVAPVLTGGVNGTTEAAAGGSCSGTSSDCYYDQAN